MSNIYEVTNEHIENLNDVQLTKILSKLMYLEASKYNIDKSVVNCSLKITVADGGEDGSIKWKNGPDCTEWLKCRYTLFQCKATEMAPGKCKDEIIYIDKDKNKKLKSMVNNVFEEKGCYILFYNKSLNQSQVEARIVKFREAIHEAEKDYYETASIYIYDANKIAAWVNDYLAAIVEVLRYNGVTLPANLLTWEEWSGYKEYSKYKFETDENIEAHIKQLREHFKGEENNIARIIGLSGLGKTRMALEVFRSDDTVENKFINRQVVYIDATYCENEIVPLVVDFRRNNISGILVVDNCNIELHKKLVNEIEHQSSKLNILTLDYNLEKITATYPIIEIKRVSLDTIKKIIKQSYNNMPEEEINRISEFAQGFPQMAVLLSEARLNGEDNIGKLNDSEIAKKLLWGRDDKDDLKLEVIKGSSVFENFGFYDDKSMEKDYIAEKICDERINKDNFYRYAKYFIDKGILDRRGRYLAVTPLPLAVRLASEWWKECSPDKGKRIMLSDMPNNMVEFLCNQISKLHFVEEARDLTRDLCGSTGPFGQAEVLTTKRGGRIFRALSKINPQVTSAAIYNAFKDYPVDELKRITRERRELIFALENLCFWEETFDNAARTLLMLAASENESWSNNATRILSQLFHIFLSGTQAKPEQRLIIVKEALLKKEEEYRIIAIRLLGSSIETGGFSRTLGAEKQGIRPISKEWQPKLWDEVFDYWEEALMLLTNIAKNKNELGKMARNEIVSSFRGLVQYGRIDALDNSLKIIGKELDYNWIELIGAIKDTIKFDSSKLPKEGSNKLDEWLNLFMPNMLKDKLKLIVSIPKWEYEKTEEENSVDVAEIKCKEFAKECIGKIDELYENLFIVYSGEQRQGFNFGKELGILINEHQKFINKSIKCLSNSDNQNPNPVVLAGYLNSLRHKNNETINSTLDYIANDKKLKEFLPYITRMINPVYSDITRLIKLFKDKENNISTFRYIAYGNCINNIDIKCIRELCISLENHSIEGKLIALEIMHKSEQKMGELRDILIRIVLDIDVIDSLNDFSQMDDYYWEKNLKIVLKDDNEEKYATKLYEAIRDSYFAYKYDLDKDKQYEIVLEILLENSPKTIWRLLVKDLINGTEEEINKLTELLKANWLHINEEATLIELVNESDVIDTITKHGVKLAFIISKIIRRYDCSNENLRFNSIIRYIIENYGEDNEKLLAYIAFNMGPTSWCGSLIPSYEEKIKVLSEYVDCDKINLRNWAIKNIDRINKDIDIERVREEEQSKGIY